MRFGKIRIEENEVRFTKVVKSCVVPCTDIRWAYQDREGIRMVTKLQKRYYFEMTPEEAKVCLAHLKECHPGLILGAPRGTAIPLVSAFNTRDLGGIPTEDGRHILPCQLLRSGDLYHLSSRDSRLLLEEYHLKRVVDFRTEEERERKPDTRMEGVVYEEAPVFEKETLGITMERSLLDILDLLKEPAEVHMMNFYQKLILDRNCQYQYAKFFQYVLEMQEDEAILWHCSAGKDRAGVASMLLLSVLGAPRGAILDDYMQSNICLKKEVEYLSRLLESRGLSKGQIDRLETILSARECYIQTAMNTILAEYGTMERYLRKALCLTPRHVQKLRNRYLV